MGKRSVNTTKSGKFMNPTDRDRKMDRKKELKKNKKNRQMVRNAVLKGKDPKHLIAEMEKIDSIEFDVINPPQFNERVLMDKRKKLKETFARVLKMYEKEEPETWKELRRLENEYETKRKFMVKHFTAVKSAQLVNVDDIPLPEMPMPMPSMFESQTPMQIYIPLPEQPPYNLKTPYSRKTNVPGVPPGPPPELDDDDSDTEDMKTASGEDGQRKSSQSQVVEGRFLMPGPSTRVPPGPPPGFPPMMYRTGGPLAGPPPRFPSNITGPIPGISSMRPPTGLHPMERPSSTSSNVFSAPPSLIDRSKTENDLKGPITIEVKPKIKNLAKIATQFMPTSLRVKREVKGNKHGQRMTLLGTKMDDPFFPTTTLPPATGPTKDQAYEEFMKEMKDFL